MQFFNITEESANLADITEKVRNGFEINDLVLIQANGLRIEDNDVTRGIKHGLKLYNSFRSE